MTHCYLELDRFGSGSVEKTARAIDEAERLVGEHIHPQQPDVDEFADYVQRTHHTEETRESVLRILLRNIDVYERYLTVLFTHWRSSIIRLNDDSPLHYAVAQRHFRFAAWLLTEGHVHDINGRNGRKETALLALCRLYRQHLRHRPPAPEESEGGEGMIWSIRSAILLLLDNGADFNVCTARAELAFNFVRRATSGPGAEFAKQCVRRANKRAIAFCDVDGWDAVVIRFHPDGGDLSVTVELLEVFMMYNQRTRFVECLGALELDDVGVQRKLIRLLMTDAVANGRQEYAALTIQTVGDRLLRTASDELFCDIMNFILQACLMDNRKATKLLLAKIKDDSLLERLLHCVLCEASQRTSSRESLLYSAELLADRWSTWVASSHSDTPLHLAAKHGFVAVAVKLLQRGCDLMHKSLVGCTPLDHGGYEFWRAVFDHFVELDIRNYSLSTLIINLSCFRATQDIRGTDEIKPILRIAESTSMNALLLHPVVHTFFQIKWNHVSKWNYLNLWLTLQTAIFFLPYCYEICILGGSNSFLRVCTCLCALCLLLREIIQMMFLHTAYVSFENVIELPMIFAIFYVAISASCSPFVISYGTIALAYELTLLLGLLPFRSLSTIMQMFTTVSKNFFSSFLLFLPLWAAFSISFLIAYNGGTASNSCHAGTASTGENFNHFCTIWGATLKTLIMATGEFEAASLDLHGTSSVLFVAFLFFIPIVLLNLINGLAVSDIAEIRKQSELVSIVRKVSLLGRYEPDASKIRPTFIRRLCPRPVLRAKQDCRVEVYPDLNKEFFFGRHFHTLETSVVNEALRIVAERNRRPRAAD